MGYPATVPLAGKTGGVAPPVPVFRKTVLTLSGEASSKAIGGRWYMT